jgi:hypothetical protein
VPSGAEHPITPPPELVQQWGSEAVAAEMPEQLYIATMAARWGGDQELEACVEWLGPRIGFATSAGLRATRRPKPKPPSKEEALVHQFRQGLPQKRGCRDHPPRTGATR